MAADLLQGALMSEPRRKDIRKRLEELLAHLAPEEVEELRQRQARFEALSAPADDGIRKWQLLLAFATFLLVPGVFLANYGFGYSWFMDLSVMSVGGLVVVTLGLRWKRRLPLRYRGSELTHAKRPLSYHLCTLALIMFAILFFISGLLAAVKHLR